MDPQPLEVWLARAVLGASTDLRPVIVFEAPIRGTAKVFLVSSALDLKTDADFSIEAEHPDFAATGLRKSSYAIAGGIRELHISAFQKRRGHLQGALALAFEAWLAG